MRPSRLFVSQLVVDQWLTDGFARLDGEILSVGPKGLSFDLKTGLLFEREPTELGDPAGLIGKVKDLDQVKELGGEYSTGTVIVGDAAYEVVEGFVGTAVPEALASLSADPRISGPLPPRDAATREPGTRDSELGMLARFFLERV